MSLKIHKLYQCHILFSYSYKAFPTTHSLLLYHIYSIINNISADNSDLETASEDHIEAALAATRTFGEPAVEQTEALQKDIAAVAEDIVAVAVAVDTAAAAVDIVAVAVDIVAAAVGMD